MMTRLQHTTVLLLALVWCASLTPRSGVAQAQGGDSLHSRIPTDIPDVTYRLAFIQQPSNAKAAAIITPPVRIQLRDAAGKNVLQPGIVISLSLSYGTGTLSGSTTRTTDSLGIATYDDLSINLIGTKQVRASGSSVQSTTSKSFSITLGPAARLRIQTEPSSTATAGVPFSRQPAVLIEDAGGNRITTDNQTTVTAARLAGSGTLQGTLTAKAQSGIATFANLSHTTAGAITILFTSGTLTPDTSATVTVSPAAAARVVFNQGPSHTTAGQVFSPPVTAGLRDAYGNTVTTTGTNITVALTSGSGTLTGTLTRSTSAGIATFNDLRINLTGSKRLTASSGSMTVAVSDTFQILPGPPKSLAFIVQPSATVAAAPITPAVTIQVRDSLGNDVTASSIPVTLALASGSGVLSGTLVRNTTSAGRATFDDVSINLVGPKTLSASSSGLRSATSASFSISAGPAAQLSFVQQPSTTTAGASIAPAVTVQVRDAQGNPAAAAGIAVTLTLSSGTGEMTGTIPQLTNATGLASFSNLSINLAGSKQLQASATGLAPALSAAFAIQPGAPARLRFTTSPSGGPAGVPFAVQPVVTLEDAFGNPVGEVSQTVTLANQHNAGPGGTLLGSTTAVVNPLTARAVFSTISVDKAGAGYTLTATGSTVSTSPGTVISSPFTVSAGLPKTVGVENAADGSGILLGAQNITSGTSILIHAVSRDTFANFVATIPAETWTLADITGGITPEDLVPAGDRKSAVFTGNRTGTARIVATAPGLTSIPSGTLTVVVGGSPSRISVETAANGTGTTVSARDIPSGTSLTVYAIGRDAAGNYIGNITAQSWTLLSKTGGVEDADLVPAADRKSALFTGRRIGSARILATSGSLTGTSTGILTVVAGTAAQIAAIGGTPQQTNVGTAFPQPLQARVRDGAGNPVPGVPVVWSAPLAGASGSFDDGGSTGLSDSAGVATSGPLVANTVAGSYQVVGSLPGGTVTAHYFLTNVVGVAKTIATAAGSPQSARVGTLFPSLLTAIVKDSLGNAVGGVRVTFSVPVSGPSGLFANGHDTASVSSDAGGFAAAPALTANSAVGAFRARATAAGVRDTALFDLSNTAGAPAQLTAVAGSYQSTAVGMIFGTRLSAAVHDSVGNPLPGVLVTFAAPTTGAGGSFPTGLTDSVRTDTTGLARASTLTANAVADSFTVVARIAGTSTTATFRLSNRPGPVDTFLVEAVGGGPIGTRVAQVPFAIRIVARDQYGNTATHFSNTAEVSSNGILAPGSSPTTPFAAGVLAAHTIVLEQPGRCVLQVTRSGGAETGRTDTFQVVNPVPSIASLAPSVGYRGQVLTVAVNGSGFVSGVTALSFGDLITTSTVVRSSTQLDVTLTIDTGAVSGVRDVFVFNTPPGGGVGTLNAAFVIGNNPAPTLTAIHPNEGSVLERMEVTLEGDNFVGGITQVEMGSGIVVHSMTVDTTTRLIADISITGPEAGGVHTVSVSNSPPGGGTSETIAFTVIAPPTSYPVPASPSDSSMIVDTVVTVRWRAWLPDGVAYRLQLSSLPTFTTTLLDTTLADTVAHVNHLARGTPYYWRVSAWNTVGSSAFSPIRSFSLTAPYPASFALRDSVRFPAYADAGSYQAKDYRLVGLPGDGGTPIDGLLSGTRNVDWIVYWDNGAATNYLVPFDGTSAFTFSVGRAFWILRKGPMAIDMTVPSVPLDSLQCVDVPLHPGWNLITNPYLSAVHWNWIQQANAPSQLADPWAFDGTFARASSLEPYRGYLFDNTGNLTSLHIPFAWPRAKEVGQSDREEWRLDIVLWSGDISSTAVTLGIAPGAHQEWDPLDLRMPRGVASGPGAAFPRPSWSDRGDIFVTDIRPGISGAESWPMEVVAPARQSARLQCSGIERVPPELAVVLIDDDKGRAHDFRKSNVYDFVPLLPVSRFRVVIGPGESVSALLDELIPRDFALGPNFPNPFNPSTAIPVAVPRTTDLTIKIYTVLGEEVRTLFQGLHEAGRFIVEWDGTNAGGRSVASGVYLIELSATGGERRIGKMMLLR